MLAERECEAGSEKRLMRGWVGRPISPALQEGEPGILLSFSRVRTLGHPRAPFHHHQPRETLLSDLSLPPAIPHATLASVGSPTGWQQPSLRGLPRPQHLFPEVDYLCL